MNRALISHCMLIVLPVLALCTVGVFFLLDKAPKLARAQKAAETRRYREAAETLHADPQLAACHGPRQKGWRQTSKIARQVPWGHFSTPTGELVWVGADTQRVAQTTVAASDDVNLAAWAYAGVSSFLFLCLALTGLGIAQIVRIERERRDFLAATAHDLATPLIAMRRLIGRDDDYAKTLNERLLRLVTNVTDFLKLGGHRPPPVCSRFTVGSAFYEAYHVFADDFADEKSGMVRVEGDVDLEVQADRLLTVQILWNLLGNDLKYAAPHGPVVLRIAAEGARVTLSFVDEGPGMTARQRRHAFDRYYRARTASTLGKGGFGIGLCAAREFARAMGGDLTVRPNEPRGTIFTLALARALAI